MYNHVQDSICWSFLEGSYHAWLGSKQVSSFVQHRIRSGDMEMQERNIGGREDSADRALPLFV